MQQQQKSVHCYKMTTQGILGSNIKEKVLIQETNTGDPIQLSVKKKKFWRLIRYDETTLAHGVNLQTA